VCDADYVYVQCDRELPQCRKCIDAGAECVQRRMGQLLDPSLPGSMSYIERLQERVRRLETDIGSIERSSVSPANPLPAHSRRVEDPADAVTDARNDTAEHLQALESTRSVMEYLPLSAMAELRDREQHSRHHYSFETFLAAATDVCGADVARSDASNKPTRDMIQAFHGDAIPSGYRLSRSVAAGPFRQFLDTFSVACPFLEPKAAFETFARVIESLGSPQDANPTSICPHDAFLVYVAVATGVLLLPGYQYKEGLVAALAHQAINLLPRILASSNNAPIVQSLIALALFSMYTTLAGSTWHIVGLALARTISAGTSLAADSSTRSTLTRSL